MHSDAELLDLHFDTRHRLKTIRQLLSQEGQRLSEASGGYLVGGPWHTGFGGH